MTILVTGGGGLVGGTLLNLLHAAGHDVRVASRNPDKLHPPEGVPAVRCDLSDPDTFPVALEGITSVFLYADPSHATAFADAAEKAGVEHLVLLSSSAVLSPDPDPDHPSPISDMHLRTERALKASPIRSTLLRPDAFASNALLWSPAARATGTVRLPYPDVQAAPVHEADIADIALAALTGSLPTGSPDADNHLTGPESLTFAEQVGHISRAVGRPIALDVVSEETWREETAAHIPTPVADALLTWWREYDGTPAETTRTVERLTGRPARSFATWAEDHADAFGA
ncbi:NAD(P)H-binding protein [Streptosporangium saharense]|uniref:NAD(P)H-binding protein n=1 Tax=Streptosporangium saharense TaxID=1706840 RepID=UPI0036AE112F